MSATRYTIRFIGRVQGVGFRFTTVRVAEGFEVTGLVRNEPDGSVFCVAEGNASDLDRFVAAIEQQMAGNIDETRVEKGNATGEFSGFSIR